MGGIARFTPEELTQMRIDDAKLENPVRHHNQNKKHPKQSTEVRARANKNYYRSHQYELCEYRKEYRQTHKAELAQANKKWREEHPNYMKEYVQNKKAATRLTSDNGVSENILNT